jgi:hypothetical protein
MSPGLQGQENVAFSNIRFGELNQNVTRYLKGVFHRTADGKGKVSNIQGITQRLAGLAAGHGPDKFHIICFMYACGE